MDQHPVVVHPSTCRFCGWAADYESDVVSRLLGLCQQRAVHVLAPGDHDYLLEVGCGTGAGVRRTAPMVAAAIGVDACPRMIERARQLGAGSPCIDFMVASAERLPFADGAFTALLCTSVLRHVGDRAAAARELARVLVPGGRVVVGDFIPHLPVTGRRGRRLAREAATASLPDTDLAITGHVVCSTFLGPYLITQATKACSHPMSLSGAGVASRITIGGP